MKRIFFRFCVVAFILLVVLVISFIVWRVILAHDISTKLAAIRAAGLPTSGAELNAYYPAVPDDKNAALVMTQAFALMRNFSDSRKEKIADFRIPPCGQPLTLAQKRLLSSYVKMNRAALAKAREAIKLPRSRYPIDFSQGLNTRLYVRPLSELCRIAEYRALLTSASNQPNDVATSIIDMLGMARTLDEEPDIISQIGRGSLLNNATAILEYSLNTRAFSEIALDHLASAFGAIQQTNLMARAFIGERAMLIPYFQSKSAWIFMDEGIIPIPVPPPMKYWVLGVMGRDLVYYLGVMDTNIAFASLPFPRDLNTINNFESKAFNPLEQHPYVSLHYHHPFEFSATFLPSTDILLKREAEYASELRCATAALAIERFRLAHGKLPEKIDEIVPQFLPAVPPDPFDGQPLRYHRLAKGYVVYSVGGDGHDDGGSEPPRKLKFTFQPGYDITFTVER